MKIPNCHFYTKPAAWRRAVDGDLLCISHFNKSFLKRVQRTINKYKLFERNDKIGIGISGGKDSVVLLDVMSKLQKKFPTELIAITVDEGIANYRDEGLKYAKIAVEKAGIEHHIVSFKEKFGHDLDEALILLGPKRKAACSTCGPFRRKSLNETARELNLTKLVTGHNADDEAQTFLMNVFRGDMLKTLQSNPRPKFKNTSFISRVKPLRRTLEQEIVLYANFNGLAYQESPCPYAMESYRGKIRDILTQYQEEDPAVVYSILNSTDLLFDMNDRIPTTTQFLGKKQIRSCIRCKEPATHENCNTCKILMDLEEKSYRLGK